MPPPSEDGPKEIHGSHEGVDGNPEREDAARRRRVPMEHETAPAAASTPWAWRMPSNRLPVPRLRRLAAETDAQTVTMSHTGAWRLACAIP